MTRAVCGARYVFYSLSVTRRNEGFPLFLICFSLIPHMFRLPDSLFPIPYSLVLAMYY